MLVLMLFYFVCRSSLIPVMCAVPAGCQGGKCLLSASVIEVTSGRDVREVSVFSVPQ